MPYLFSGPSIVQTTTINTGEWWIKDPLGYVDDLLVHVPGNELSRARMQQSAAYRPLGRRYPIVVSDAVEGYSGSVDFEFVGALDDFEKLKAIFDEQRVMLLQSGWLKEQYYVRFRDNWQEKIANTDPPYRVVSVDYLEQEKPA